MPLRSRKLFKFIRYFSISQHLLNDGLITLGGGAYAIYDSYRNVLPINANLYEINKDYIPIEVTPPGNIFYWVNNKMKGDETILVLVANTNSSNDQIRRKAVYKLAQIKDFTDSEAKEISKHISQSTSIGLANLDADLRLIPDPRPLNYEPDENFFGTCFRQILSALPSDSVHATIDKSTKSALKLFIPTEEEKSQEHWDLITGFESDLILNKNPAKRLTEDEFLTTCLKALLSHSRMKEQIHDLIKLKTLDLLRAVVEKYNANENFMVYVVKIVANLSFHTSSIEHIINAGLLKFLAQFSQSDQLRLSLPSKRALHNMDREYHSPLLPSSTYQLYPSIRYDETQLDIDVVFVHGLLGGVFRTWRRQDNERVKMKKSFLGIKDRILSFQKFYNDPKLGGNPDRGIIPHCREMDEELEEWIYYDGLMPTEPLESENMTSKPTQCWPKDWLPHDVEKSRIIAVDFDSFVSKWRTITPIESLNRTLFDRSHEQLEKLTAIGIGNKPVVWVTHSMGGILVKNLLILASESKNEEYKNVAKNTKGIIFLSVPHIGSHIASLNQAGHLFLMPTTEVLELSKDSQELPKLHEKFISLVNKYKYKLMSFGEHRETQTSLGVTFKLVPYYSADPEIGDFYSLDLDHLNMCKPYGRGSFIYLKIVEMIQKVKDEILKSSHDQDQDQDQNEGENLKTQIEKAEKEKNQQKKKKEQLLAPRVKKIVDSEAKKVKSSGSEPSESEF